MIAVVVVAAMVVAVGVVVVVAVEPELQDEAKSPKGIRHRSKRFNLIDEAFRNLDLIR